MTAPACPECVQGKHPNCDGTAWDPDTDDEGVCPCAQGGHVNGSAAAALALHVALPLSRGPGPACKVCGKPDSEKPQCRRGTDLCSNVCEDVAVGKAPNPYD